MARLKATLAQPMAPTSRTAVNPAQHQPGVVRPQEGLLRYRRGDVVAPEVPFRGIEGEVHVEVDQARQEPAPGGVDHRLLRARGRGAGVRPDPGDPLLGGMEGHAGAHPGARAVPQAGVTDQHGRRLRPGEEEGRASTARAWASKPSARARRAAVGPIWARRSAGRPTTLMIFTKSSTERGEAKRAVPPVGMMWLGPAT